MYTSHPVVAAEDLRLEFLIEPEKIIRINYPTVNAGFRLFDALIVEFGQIEAPWSYDCLFNMLPFQGHIDFSEIEHFSESWYQMVGGGDVGRKVATVSLDPLTASRLNAYRQLFPSRVFELFDTLDTAYAWMRCRPTR